MRPYIGIAGVTSRIEAELALGRFRKYAETSDVERKLMIGALVSLKTLYEKKNKYPNRYPDVSKLPDIFYNRHDDALNIIHYSTDEYETLYAQLLALHHLAGEYLDGFQLNVVWPDFEEIALYKTKYPNKKIILQVGRRAFNDKEFTDKIKEYDGLIDYVLIDPSGGKGLPFWKINAVKYLMTVENTFPKINLALAGRIGPDSLKFVAPLLDDFPNLSIDAESGLRNEGDHLDMEKVEEYIKRYFELFADI